MKNNNKSDSKIFVAAEKKVFKNVPFASLKRHNCIFQKEK